VSDFYEMGGIMLFLQSLLSMIVHDLGEGFQFITALLPANHIGNAATTDALWQLHPAEKHRIMMIGREVETPRFQQAFGADYQYTGRTNRALPVPPLLAPLLAWVHESIDQRLNGLLLNWYDGPEHYIGPHHDSTKNMIEGAPIVTLSFGETRIFRLSRGKGAAQQVKDFPASHGTVIVMPYQTNLVWKHAVPKSARYTGRRISVTLRVFQDGVLEQT